MITVVSCRDSSPERDNPLLAEWDAPYGVPPLDRIKAEDYMPALREAMAVHRGQIDSIVANPAEPDFRNTVQAYDESGMLLTDIANILYGVAAADTYPLLQSVMEKAGPMLSEHFDAVMLDTALFSRIRKVYDKRLVSGLDPLQVRLTEKVYNDFVRNGAALGDDDKKELARINRRLSELTFAFGDKLLREVDSFELVLGIDDVTKLPSGLRNMARQSSKQHSTGDDNYRFDLTASNVFPLLTYLPQRDLRERIYTAYVEKCSHGDQLDNSETVNEIVELRNRKARLLGYDTYAAYALADEMAGTPEAVYELLDGIWTPALAQARADLATMTEMMKDDTGSDDFQPWDWWYYAEKLRKRDYDIDTDELRPYLSLENVKQGVFELANKLYGVTFQPVVLPVYNRECITYEALDADGSLLGLLYMDLHPRPGRKASGAWCGTFRDSGYRDGERTVPVVYLVANFTRSSTGAPALLDLEEAKTFFHEFGHALHFLFTDVPYRGLLNVENDFVELPSQIMENWATRPEMLRSYAIHWQNGKVMPGNMIEKIRRSETFNQGFNTVELVAAAYLDMDVHNMEQYVPFDVEAFQNRVLGQERGLIPQIAPRYALPYFSHIFDGEYAAGYYGYLWSEVLDKDAFGAFLETGELFNRRVADRFRSEVLAKGGSEDGSVLYQNFRGRQPSREPMLRARGLVRDSLSVQEPEEKL